jgi:hypothetical protein
MAKFKTTDQDRRELQLCFALVLFDQFTEQNHLLGKMMVRIVNQPLEKLFLPLQKAPDAVFAFLHLSPGDYIAEIESDEDTPYYRKASIVFRLPMPSERWRIYHCRWTIRGNRKPIATSGSLRRSSRQPLIHFPKTRRCCVGRCVLGISHCPAQE